MADENISGRYLAAAHECGLSISYVRDIMRGARDEDVFAHALRRDCLIVTHDRDFDNFGNLDYTFARGAAIFPSGSRDPRRREIILLAVRHFINEIAPFMARERGIVTRYKINGTYVLRQEGPDRPCKPVIIKTGSYING